MKILLAAVIIILIAIIVFMFSSSKTLYTGGSGKQISGEKTAEKNTSELTDT